MRRGTAHVTAKDLKAGEDACQRTTDRRTECMGSVESAIQLLEACSAPNFPEVAFYVHMCVPMLQNALGRISCSCWGCPLVVWRSACSKIRPERVAAISGLDLLQSCGLLVNRSIEVGRFLCDATLVLEFVQIHNLHMCVCTHCVIVTGLQGVEEPKGRVIATCC